MAMLLFIKDVKENIGVTLYNQGMEKDKDYGELLEN
jgi:hypothetical protein